MCREETISDLPVPVCVFVNVGVMYVNVFDSMCVYVYIVCVVWLVAAPVVHVELQGAYTDTFHLYKLARLMSV